MASDSPRPARRFRSRDWFDDPAHLDSGGVMETALKYRGVCGKTPRHNH